MGEQPADPILEPMQFRAAWVGLEDVSVVLVNQLLVQLDDVGDVIVTLGQAVPPVIAGSTPEERAKEDAAVPFIQVRPMTRFTMAPRRLRDLISLLQQVADKQEEAKRMLEEHNK